MRPLTIKMSAFGSYNKEVLIDFTKLQEGVFLITGDTGAGKTTIFDGIMYALYGQTSGGRREGAMMRSQYADVNTKTFVELEFRNRGEIYRVFRNPEYMRESKRKNKDGTYALTKEKANVALYLPDGTLFRGKMQETNGKLIEILGMDARQFSQISMIAQGDFLKLLLAKSDERKEIFSGIFDTHIFWKIQEELKRREKEIYGELEDNRKSILQELKQLECSEEEEVQQKRELVERAEKEPDLEQSLIFLKEMTFKATQQYKKVHKKQESYTKELEQKNQMYSLAKEQSLRFEKFEQLKQEIFALEQDKEKWKEKQNILAVGKKSGLVRPLEYTWLQAKKTFEEIEKRLENLNTWFLNHGKEIEEQKKNLDLLEKQQKKLEETTVPRIDYWNHALNQYTILQEKIQNAQELKRQKDKVLVSYETVQNRYHQMAEEYERQYQLYFQEQAGILAQTLVQGQPCPVCGSCEHPKKALLSQAAPNQEQVEKLKKLRDLAERQRDEEQNRYLQISREFDQQIAVIYDLERQIEKEEQESIPLEQMEKKWNKWEKEVRNQLQLSVEKLETGRKKVLLETQAYQRAIQEESLRRGQLEENQILFQSQKDVVEKEQRLFLREIANQGFEDETAYRAAFLEKEKLDSLEREIEAEQKRRMELEQKQKIYEEQLIGQEKPNLSILEEELQKLREEQKNVEEQARKVYSQRENNRRIKERLEELAEKRSNMREYYARVHTLCRTANGNLTGTVKIDFESYVQRQYFEKMIYYANRHLQQMAGGQFLLKCRSMELLSTHGNAGLDLDVYSLLSGKVRDVKTLSGGESFMAALALALGMSDVVTRTTGAIQIETLFIDEGFGSLDDHSREQAVRILSGLSGSGRLVGIISHVTELKEQVQQKLVITKTKHGSVVSWS